MWNHLPQMRPLSECTSLEIFENCEVISVYPISEKNGNYSHLDFSFVVRRLFEIVGQFAMPLSASVTWLTLASLRVL